MSQTTADFEGQTEQLDNSNDQDNFGMIAALASSQSVKRDVLEKIAFVLGANPEDIDLQIPLTDLGVDSLAATELAMWVEKTYGFEVSQTEFLSGITAARIIETVGAINEGGAPQKAGPSVTNSAVPSSAHTPETQYLEQLRSPVLLQASSDSFALPDGEVTASRVEAIGQEGESGGTSSSQDVLEKIAFVLGANPEDIDLQIPLTDLGVDSLAATELAMWVEKTYGFEVSQTEFLSGITAARIIETVGAVDHSSEINRAEATEPFQALKSSTQERETPLVPNKVWSRKLDVEAHSNNGNGSVRVASGRRLPVFRTEHSHTYRADPAVNFKDIQLVEKPSLENGHTTIWVPEKLNPESLRTIISQVEVARKLLVLRRSPGAEHFCEGMDLKQTHFGDQILSDGLDLFQQLAELLKNHPLPVVCVVEGACRGGGMMFPAVSSVVLAAEEATFGLPEIRRGGLPGVVSYYLQNRVAQGSLRPALLTGDLFCSKFAQDKGLVDIRKPADAVDRELQRLLGRFNTISPILLQEAKRFCPASSPEQAMIAMGGLDPHERQRERDADALVRLRYCANTGIAIVELNDPDFNNAIDWAIADDLSRVVETIKQLKHVCAIVLQGSGDHFCVGVNPYSFIRRTKSLPIATAARVTFDIYDAFVGLREIGAPIICALQGKVMGGGLAVSLNADYRVAAQDATFNYGNLSRGVCPGLLLSENLSRCVGANWANELYLNDYTLNAEQAKLIGLVNEVSETAKSAQKSALEMACRLAEYPSLGVAATLDLMRPAIDRDRLARESEKIARCNIKGSAFSAGWKTSERQIETPLPPTIYDTGMTSERHLSKGLPEVKKKIPIGLSSSKNPETQFDEACVNANDWDWESDVFTGLESSRGQTANLSKGRCRNDDGLTKVLLTGATGFLGAFILRDLLSRSNTHIVCLVRAASEAEAFKRIFENLEKYGLRQQADIKPRLTVVLGDLAKARLGLSPHDYDQIAKTSEVIIHNGACVDFSASLDRLRPINVDAVRQIVQLAAAHEPSQLIYVSSLSVFSLHHFEGSAGDLRPDPKRLLNAYSRSKWLGEQIALLAKKHGLNVSIVRPGRIMGDSKSGASNVDDWFTRFLQSSIVLGKIWDIDHETDMTPVDGVSHMVVGCIGEPIQNRTWHAISQKVLTTSQILHIVKKRGFTLQTVPFDDWVSSARALVASNEGSGILPLLETFESTPNIGEKPTVLRFSSDMSEVFQTGGEELLEKMLDWLIARGALPSVPVNMSKPIQSQVKKSDCTRSFTGTSSSLRFQQAFAERETSALVARNVGIHAMEVYFPSSAIRQSELESFNECPGKYTAGLGQESISFCCEDEDAVSMALTAIHRLMEKHGIGFDEIGRIDVGTESLVDRSKSIKTYLMSLFGEKGNHDVEGVDSYNACYGGTAAFLNAVSWCQSEAWDGRYALVVATDIAGLDTQQAFLNGAAAVVMLVGPDAPVVVEPVRASHMMHTWDFYKPIGWRDPFPIMPDGKHSIEMYLACLRGCYQKLSQKLGGANLLEIHDHAIFHCASTYLCKRAFDEFAKLSNTSLGLARRRALYEEMTEPSVKLTKHIGSTYTASCYVNLYSLFYYAEQDFQSTSGKNGNSHRISVFSYGSGSASTLYSLRVHDLPLLDKNTLTNLEQRDFHGPQAFFELSQGYADTYGKFDFRPNRSQRKRDGVYYLDSVDKFGVRQYSRET